MLARNARYSIKLMQACETAKQAPQVTKQLRNRPNAAFTSSAVTHK